MELGQIGGLNYRMTPRGQQPTQSQNSRYIEESEIEGNEDLKDLFDDPLAVRRDRTRNLFNSYALLKSLMKDAESKGINYSTPDYSQEGGGLAYQAFLEADAGVRYDANLLKLEREKEKMIDEARLRGDARIVQGYDPTTQLYTNNPNAAYSTKPLPFLDQANKFSDEDTYTQNDEARANETYYDAAYARIDEMERSGQMGKDQADLSRAYLQRNLSKTPYQSLIAGDKAETAKDKANAKSLMTLFQRVTNHSRGAWTDGTYQNKIIQGVPYAVSADLKDERYGETQIEKTDSNGNTSYVTVPKIIKATLKDAEGNVYFQFQNPDIPWENVSDTSPDEVTRRLVESNSSKYGGTGSIPILYNELEKAGQLSSNRSVKPNVVYGSEAVEQTKKARPNIPGWSRIEEHYKNEFNRLQDPNSTLSVIKVKGRDGKDYNFTFDSDDGVMLKNWKELGYTDQNRLKDISFEQYLDVLDRIGAWDQWMQDNKSTLERLEKNEKQGGKSKVPDNLTAEQQRAIVEFSIREKRDPSPDELNKILGSSKPIANKGGKKAY